MESIAQSTPVVIPETILAKEYGQMADVDFKWMQGGGEARPWLCPIYGMSAELEVLELLYSMVKLIRPKLIVEAGCHLGIGTYALGRAAKEIGSQVVTCDVELPYIDATRERCKELPVSVVLCRAESLGEVREADFLFLDGSYESRIACVPRMKSGAIAIMHDTRQELPLREAFNDLGSVVHLDSWRGASIFRRN